MILLPRFIKPTLAKIWPPPAWQFLAKLGLDGAFWQMVKTTFGYAEETPTLRNLLIRLLLPSNR